METMKINRNIITPSLIFGALWGISEATLGFLLHLASRLILVPSLAGFFMFPIGVFFMLAAYRTSGSVYAILLTASIAAAFKFASMIMPSVSPVFVINPAVSILAEGFAVLLFIFINRYLKDRMLIPKTVLISVAWRVIFLLAVIILPVPKGILSKGTVVLLRFLLLEAAVNGLIIGLLMKVKIPWRRASGFLEAVNRPLTGLLLSTLAVVLTFSLTG